MNKMDISAHIERLKDPDAGVRIEAAWALGEIGPDASAAVPALAEALGDPDANVRHWVKWAVEKIEASEGGAA